MILGSTKAVDRFRVGAAEGPVVLGQDLSLGKTLGFDVIEDANIFATRDVITHSLADGAIVDWSLIGMCTADRGYPKDLSWAVVHCFFVKSVAEQISVYLSRYCSSARLKSLNDETWAWKHSSCIQVARSVWTRMQMQRYMGLV
jgi:hypothetical protein